VFVYETTPAFMKDPFFLRGMSLYKDQVAIVTAPEWQEKVRKDPTAEMIRGALVQANKNLKILSDAGIPIAMGTDSGVSGAGNVGRWQGFFEQLEMEMMNKAGMSPMKVIVASTGDAAKIMGLKQVGTLQPGNWADLVVLRANPLDNIRNTRTIDSVWIAGGKLADVAPVSATK
jgi:imidazolonepropionase-like amidohydrolase